MDKKRADNAEPVAHDGSYTYTRMLFGLLSAPATFQKAMGAVLATLAWQHALVYIENTVTFLKTLERHLRLI